MTTSAISRKSLSVMLNISLSGAVLKRAANLDGWQVRAHSLAIKDLIGVKETYGK
jgi:hypothetical protein